MTPQQKKALSYKKDRRNQFGQSTIASRKGVRCHKLRMARAGRRRSHQTLAMPEIQEEVPDTLDAVITLTPKNFWQKLADRPLGEALAARLSQRITYACVHYPEEIQKMMPKIARELAGLGLPPSECAVACAELNRHFEVPWNGGHTVNATVVLPLWKALRRVMERHSLTPLKRLPPP